MKELSTHRWCLHAASVLEMQTTTFLDLPAELRNAIYLEAINTVPAGIITLTAGDLNNAPEATNTSHHRLSLLCTTRQINTETLPIFLSNRRIRITEAAWPRIFTRDSYLASITNIIIDKAIAKSISTTLMHAGALPNLRTLYIRISNFRFAKVKRNLEKGFPVLKKLHISDPKLEALMQHLALEEVRNDQEMVMPSSCIYSVEDFQAWRWSWDKSISLRTVDQELETEARERMTGMVAMRLF